MRQDITNPLFQKSKPLFPFLQVMNGNEFLGGKPCPNAPEIRLRRPE